MSSSVPARRQIGAQDYITGHKGTQLRVEVNMEEIAEWRRAFHNRDLEMHCRARGEKAEDREDTKVQGRDEPGGFQVEPQAVRRPEGGGDVCSLNLFSFLINRVRYATRKKTQTIS